MLRDAPPKLSDACDVGSLIPRPLLKGVRNTPLRDSLAQFRQTHRVSSKPEELLLYLREFPENSPNTRKLSASLIWIYFAEGDSNDTRIIYAEGKGWFVYDGYWKEQGETLLDFIIALQTDFLLCIQEVRSVVSARNIFKNLANGEMHPRRKHLLDLEIAISSASKCVSMAEDCRPYFLSRARMDANPMLLQLQNGTVDLETNTIRGSRPQDFTSKISRVRIPDYATPGRNRSPEPPCAKEHRNWILDFIWSIFRPGPDLQPHNLDEYARLGSQDSQNCYFFLCVLARLLEGRPVKRSIFLFSPRGRNSKRPIEELLRYILGTYSVLCKNSFFSPDRKGEETNNSIALSRESTRLVFGQEIDFDTPWCNATFKRRSDCGREGGTRKHSNLVEEFDPVYTVVFGCNNPPQFIQPPGSSEEDRALIIYLPNKFCDAGKIDEEPVSPRRFLKDPSIDDRTRTNDSAWALLQVLLHVRRSNPDLDRILSDGTPTSRKFHTE